MRASLAEGSNSPTSATSFAVKTSASRGARDCINIIPGPVNLRNSFGELDLLEGFILYLQ